MNNELVKHPRSRRFGPARLVLTVSVAFNLLSDDRCRAQIVDYTWTGPPAARNPSGDWTDEGNWSPSRGIPNSFGVTATIDLDRTDAYEVRVDPASLPATYVVQNLKPQTVTVDPLNSGRLDFVVRAYRSVLGTVRVFDACSGTYVPVPGVEVKLKSLEVVSTTDEAGRYAFRELPAGQHTLVATKGGNSAATTVTTARPTIFQRPGSPRECRRRSFR